MVSVKDVAVAAGVSVGTVSNVLNHPDKVSPATVQRVQQVIAELGFVRNDAARQLRAGRSRSIGLVVLDVGNPFFAEVARGAEQRAAEENLVVLLGGADQSPERESAYLDLFREQRVLGVLITPVSDDLAALRRLDAAGIPVILVDREMPEESFRSVSVDDVEGGYLAVSHLLERGRRRIAVVAGPASIPQVADRLEGARRAVAEHSDATLEVIEVAALTVLEGREVGERIRLAQDRPDAVFAVNDLLAVGVLQALAFAGSGVRVPEDVALIGYDDIDFAASTVVPLSSIRQPARMLGRTAVDLLLAEPEGAGERTIRYRPELVVRESTAGVSAN
ncbi:LacI family DNA-binding transcriptional regulator [Microbacterium panaciterrae]|uniref:LacI family DNA-binding transcriptional regulator n=1 Tax=Microbacterium panaciterrae TaxID=985759 RepID=A0ABP8PHW9_9MICO